MNHEKLRGELFDTLLKAAVEEDFQRELDEMPPQESLKEQYAPSPELRRKIQKLAADERRRENRKKVIRTAKKVALIFAVMIPVSMAGLLSVEASRNAIFNAVLQWNAGHADIFFQQKGSSSSTASQDGGADTLFKPQYVPDGFTEVKTIKISRIQKVTYQNKNNVEIIFCQSPLSDTSKLKVDTENEVYEKISINGQEASLFVGKTSNDRTVLLWKNGKNNLELSSTLNQKELIKMAESVKSQKK